MLAIVGLLIALSGCSSGANSEPPSSGGVVDATGAWQMASGVVDGVGFRIVPDAPITLTVKGSEVGGRSACNHYGAEMLVEFFPRPPEHTLKIALGEETIELPLPPGVVDEPTS